MEDLQLIEHAGHLERRLELFKRILITINEMDDEWYYYSAINQIFIGFDIFGNFLGFTEERLDDLHFPAPQYVEELEELVRDRIIIEYKEHQVLQGKMKFLYEKNKELYDRIAEIISERKDN